MKMSCVPALAALLCSCANLIMASAPVAAEEPDWLNEAKTHIPSGWVAGRVYRMDEEAMKAFVAVFPKGADSPATPGNAFDPGRVLEVALKRENGELVYTGTVIYSRALDDRIGNQNEDYHAEIVAELQAQADAEPDVVPCRIKAWALSESRKGTAVRKAPDDEAAIVGRLAPPNRWPQSEAAGDEWKVEFDITGYKDGWFRIANAEPPGAPYLDPPPAGHPETYSGTGWIKATDATGAYANTQMPVARLLQYPHVDAQDYQPAEFVAGGDGSLSGDGTLMQLHACSANWALTTSKDFQRGWWRGICSNQVTNCS
jgi:hypothetical protein